MWVWQIGLWPILGMESLSSRKLIGFLDQFPTHCDFFLPTTGYPVSLKISPYCKMPSEALCWASPTSFNILLLFLLNPLYFIFWFYLALQFLESTAILFDYCSLGTMLLLCFFFMPLLICYSPKPLQLISVPEKTWVLLGGCDFIREESSEPIVTMLADCIVNWDS